MNDSIILSLAMLVGTIIILIGNVFSLMIDILYSLFKSKKISKNKKQYWIVGNHGCRQVNSMKELIVYRLEIDLFTVVSLFLFYIGLLIYINVK